jgi:hypothetical protein
MTDLPALYFRVKDNGATVFRVGTDARAARIEMDPIASVNLRNGEVKAQGDRKLDRADLEAIRDWMAERSRLLAARDLDDILRAIDHLNQTAHWAQSRASDDELDEVTDRLLLAMHDLRSVLVRRKADRLKG